MALTRDETLGVAMCLSHDQEEIFKCNTGRIQFTMCLENSIDDMKLMMGGTFYDGAMLTEQDRDTILDAVDEIRELRRPDRFLAKYDLPGR